MSAMVFKLSDFKRFMELDGCNNLVFDFRGYEVNELSNWYFFQDGFLKDFGVFKGSAKSEQLLSSVDCDIVRYECFFSIHKGVPVFRLKEGVEMLFDMNWYYKTELIKRAKIYLLSSLSVEFDNNVVISQLHEQILCDLYHSLEEFYFNVYFMFS